MVGTVVIISRAIESLKSSMSSIKTRKRVFDYKSLSDFGRTEEKVIKKFKV